MKRALSLLIVGVLLLAIGVGTWVDACTPKRVGYRVIEPSGEGAGLGAGLTVFACAMAAGGIVMIIKRGKTKS
jgi:hypothetical protein